jgi:hypothetical protein
MPSDPSVGGLDLLAGVTAAGRGQRPPARAAAKPGKDIPGGEPADELGMVRLGDAGEVPGEPPLEKPDLLADGGEHAAPDRRAAKLANAHCDIKST